MIKLKSLIAESNFGRSGKVTHVMDVPMFSVYVPTSSISQELLQAKYGDIIRTECDKARYEIHKIGFPSMHANIVITDLSKEYNKNTGGGVGGRATPYKKYMEVDINSFRSNLIVHEWAHLWMFNHSKEFKSAIKVFYNKLMKDTGEKVSTSNPITTTTLSSDESMKILDYWVNAIKKMFFSLLSSSESESYIFKNKKITPDLFSKLPHSFIFSARLKVPINGNHYNGRTHRFDVGEVVDVEKGNDGWLIGKRLADGRYEILTKGFDVLMDYVESNVSGNLIDDITVELKKYESRFEKPRTTKYLESRLKERMESQLEYAMEDISGKSRIKFSPEDIKTVKSWSKYIFPEYLKILRNRKLISYYETNRNKVYEALWVSNELKPKDLSFMTFFTEIRNRHNFDTNKKIFSDRHNLSGLEYKEHREYMSKLNNWVDSYGMSNDDEVWATAIEYFFELPIKYRKILLKIMASV